MVSGVRGHKPIMPLTFAARGVALFREVSRGVGASLPGTPLPQETGECPRKRLNLLRTGILLLSQPLQNLFRTLFGFGGQLHFAGYRGLFAGLGSPWPMRAGRFVGVAATRPVPVFWMRHGVHLLSSGRLTLIRLEKHVPHQLPALLQRMLR